MQRKRGTILKKVNKGKGHGKKSAEENRYIFNRELSMRRTLSMLERITVNITTR